MSTEPHHRETLPARVIGPTRNGLVEVIVCPDIEEWNWGKTVEVPADFLPADAGEPDTPLLVTWDGAEDGAGVVSALYLPDLELRVHLPGPFTQAEYPPLVNRTVAAINAALRRHQLGPDVGSWVGGPGSHDAYWECSVWTHDLPRAVGVLREVLTRLEVQPHARIDVCPNDIPFRVVRSYPLAPHPDDWADLDEVERQARHPPEQAFSLWTPCDCG